jgi:hypothetical protein
MISATKDSTLRETAGSQYDPGAGNYTEERRTLLPDWDASTLIQKAKELQKPRESGT